MAIVSLGFSTVNLYLAKKFFLPFTADISYRNRFAGKSNVTKSQYVSFNLTFFLDTPWATIGRTAEGKAEQGKP